MQFTASTVSGVVVLGLLDPTASMAGQGVA
jgi:hypothetical protein